jgi:hypothetical protein
MSKHFDWQFPYASQRMPVLARNMVATSQPLAAQAGLRMLWKGGNAVDAILATAISLTVLEPTSNGIGSDAFGILWDGKKLHGLNASGRSPAAWSHDRFKSEPAMPTRGLGIGHRAGCREGVGRPVRKIRQASLRRPLRACDQVRGRRIHGLADDCTPVGEPGTRASVAAGLCRCVHASWPCAGAGGEVFLSCAGEDAAAHRRE